jgi:hypothetical protein
VRTELDERDRSTVVANHYSSAREGDFDHLGSYETARGLLWFGTSEDGGERRDRLPKRTGQDHTG